MKVFSVVLCVRFHMTAWPVSVWKNCLLLFGTKIVTLFGQRKNVFVKQKHSGAKIKLLKVRFVDVACVCLVVVLFKRETGNLAA